METLVASSKEQGFLVSVPETKFTQSGEVSIAYQVVGDGPFDLVVVPGFVSHLEQAWEDPSFSRFLLQLASFSRLILFDKRGTGLSDRISGIPTLEERMDDVRAVMDAVGSERAALFGIPEGAPCLDEWLDLAALRPSCNVFQTLSVSALIESI